MNHCYVTLRKVKDTKRKFALSWKIWKLLEVTTGNDFSSSFKEFKENGEVDGSVEDYGKELKGALLQVFRKYFGGIYETNKVELWPSNALRCSSWISWTFTYFLLLWLNPTPIVIDQWSSSFLLAKFVKIIPRTIRNFHAQTDSCI